MSRAGVYIHVPFCRSRCSYCDFATGTYDAPLAQRYLSAVEREVRSFAPEGVEAKEVDTVYFGGGTPSMLAPAEVERLLAAVRARFSVCDDAEVTLELNPGTVTPETLRELRRLGV